MCTRLLFPIFLRSKTACVESYRDHLSAPCAAVPGGRPSSRLLDAGAIADAMPTGGAGEQLARLAVGGSVDTGPVAVGAGAAGLLGAAGGQAGAAVLAPGALGAALRNVAVASACRAAVTWQEGQPLAGTTGLQRARLQRAT